MDNRERSRSLTRTIIKSPLFGVGFLAVSAIYNGKGDDGFANIAYVIGAVQLLILAFSYWMRARLRQANRESNGQGGE